MLWAAAWCFMGKEGKPWCVRSGRDKQRLEAMGFGCTPCGWGNWGRARVSHCMSWESGLGPAPHPWGLLALASHCWWCYPQHDTSNHGWAPQYGQQWGSPTSVHSFVFAKLWVRWFWRLPSTSKAFAWENWINAPKTQALARSQDNVPWSSSAVLVIFAVLPESKVDVCYHFPVQAMDLSHLEPGCHWDNKVSFKLSLRFS